MITSKNTSRAVWASAATVGMAVLAGLVVAAIGSSAGEAVQLSADVQPAAEHGVSEPASELEEDGSVPVAPIETTGSEQSSDPSTDSESPSPSTPEDPEVVEGAPGVVVANSDTATGPSSPPEPPLVVEDVDFVPVPKTPPSAEPIDILQVGSSGPNSPDGGGGESGGFAPNVSGCALACVTKAILTPNVTTPNLGLDVAATVPARIDITLTNTQSGKRSLFTSRGSKTQWSTTLSPLAPGTDYDLVLEAIDQEGQRQVHTTTLTTRTPLDNPGGLQTNQPGCAGRCIVQATVTSTERPDEVRFDVVTDTPASVKIWMSTSAPQWVDDIPTLPADTIVEPTLGIKQEFSVEKAFLDPKSWYHVIVRAEDDHGVDYQVGTFTTADRPPSQVDVRINFELIFVQWDGDSSPLDRGELSFAMGYLTGDIEPNWWYRSEEKMDGGTTVLLGDETEHWTTLDGIGLLPSPGVTAYERDGLFPEDLTPRLLEAPSKHGRDSSNPAWGPPMTLDQLRNQQTCGEMGVESADSDAYCVSFQTTDQNDEDYPNIQVIVSYELH